jgi:hypothetical protein
MEQGQWAEGFCLEGDRGFDGGVLEIVRLAEHLIGTIHRIG